MVFDFSTSWKKLDSFLTDGNLQLKAFILILSFSSLASKGLQAPKVEKHLSYIECDIWQVYKYVIMLGKLTI